MENTDFMNTKPQIKDMFKISFWIVGFLSVFISGCTIYADSLLVEGLQMHPILVGVTILFSIFAAIFFAIMIVGMVYNTFVIFRWAWNHLRFISILLCLILLIVAVELGGILYTIASIKEIIRYKKQKKIYESFCGKLEKKRISVIKIVLLVILCIILFFSGLVTAHINKDEWGLDNPNRNSEPSPFYFNLNEDELTCTIAGLHDLSYTDLVIESEIDGYKVTGIEEWAFAGCFNITSVVIEDGIKEIGYCAFYQCYSLESITIPSSVTYIESDTFNYCSSLESINFDGTIEEWQSILPDDWYNNGTNNFTVYCTDGAINQ